MDAFQESRTSRLCCRERRTRGLRSATLLEDGAEGNVHDSLGSFELLVRALLLVFVTYTLRRSPFGGASSGLFTSCGSGLMMLDFVTEVPDALLSFLCFFGLGSSADCLRLHSRARTEFARLSGCSSIVQLLKNACLLTVLCGPSERATLEIVRMKGGCGEQRLKLVSSIWSSLGNKAA
jgi:hypothetical protein